MPRIEKNSREKKKAKSFWEPLDSLSGMIMAIGSLIGAIAAILTIISAWPRPNVFFPPDTLARPPTSSISHEIPSATLPTPSPDLNIQAFTVELNGDRQQIRSSETITVPMNAFLVVQPQVIYPYLDLSFQWESCRNENRFGALDIGSHKVSYVADKLGADCISLSVQKGGERLGKGLFYLNVFQSK